MALQGSPTVSVRLQFLSPEHLYQPRTFWDIYRKAPDVLCPILHTLRDCTQRLTRLPHVTLSGTEANADERALTTMEQALLLPRDAYHWTLMQRHGLNAIATTDADFTRL